MNTHCRPKSKAARWTADVVLFTKETGVLSVLVVERAKEPYRAALALPGGFVEPGERPVDAAARELCEETGVLLAADRLQRFGCYGRPGRDPRGPVVSVAHHGYLPGAPPVVGGDDASRAAWVGLPELFAIEELAFDHRDIIGDAVFRRFGWRMPVSVDKGATSPGGGDGRNPAGRGLPGDLRVAPSVVPSEPGNPSHR
ncbi:ADP-ribose pyrophosphatase [Actinoalloteichus sp. GBA129-24]|uniref:ADP-ribose pyrophosphatase n=1 Tax=Actinoalloteichus fjordicus TaxID=1612552 RepID=A0AAC9LFM6_9PSEU|nr:ADP-ribose pyrophosphatase [Actinoalloteichus fjordicus]APU21513.1 ADP-ribose pyrophosphatase [Actinoalloteichus sp. GBA129-24]